MREADYLQTLVSLNSPPQSIHALLLPLSLYGFSPLWYYACPAIIRYDLATRARFSPLFSFFFFFNSICFKAWCILAVLLNRTVRLRYKQTLTMPNNYNTASCLFIYLFFVFRLPVAVLVVWQCPSAHLLLVLFMRFIIAGSWHS